MRSFKSAAFILTMAIATAAVADQQPTIDLVLMNQVNPASTEQFIRLLDPSYKQCQYIGVVEHRDGQPTESGMEKVLQQALGNPGTWSIKINTRVCESIQQRVSYRAKLRNLVAKEYQAGEHVQAVEE